MEQFIYYIMLDDIDEYDQYKKPNGELDFDKIKASPLAIKVTLLELINGLNEENISDTSLFALWKLQFTTSIHSR